MEWIANYQVLITWQVNVLAFLITCTVASTSSWLRRTQALEYVTKECWMTDQPQSSHLKAEIRYGISCENA